MLPAARADKRRKCRIFFFIIKPCLSVFLLLIISVLAQIYKLNLLKDNVSRETFGKNRKSDLHRETELI